MYWASTARRLLCVIAVVAALLGSATLAATPDPEDTLGRKYADEIKRDYVMVDDPAILDRVQRIGKELAEIANQIEVPAGYGSSEISKFDYEFAVIKDSDPNAFSLPGGKIFINSGLIEMVTSDDELAGVIAHEVAHAAHHHVSQIIKQQAKIDRYVALVALLGIVSKARSKDLNNMLLGASMMRQGQVSGYTMQAEQDADRTAVVYMAKSKYNPIGLVDFMRKLEAKHEESPGQPLGIYQTHPAPFRRVSNIRKACQENGIKIDMRKLRGVAHADATETTPGSGDYEVKICGKVVYAPASLGGQSSSKTRADDLASAVNALLDSDIRPEDLTIDEDNGCLLVKGKVLLKIESKDLQPGNESPRALLGRAREALMRAAWADWLVNTTSSEEFAQP